MTLQKGYWLKEGRIRWKKMTEFVRLRAKTYSYLIDDGSENKKEKGTEGCVIKKYLN